MKILELCGAAALATPLFLHEVKQEKRGEVGEEGSEGRKWRGEGLQARRCDKPLFLAAAFASQPAAVNSGRYPCDLNTSQLQSLEYEN